jgi:hypothetical protein
MHIEEISIGQLAEFVYSQKFKQFNELPITVHRALSQTKNPRVSKNDIVLIIAYNDNNEILGYVGALPDLINGTKKVAWNSCWYANTALNKTIALPLFLQFMKNWRGKILMQDLTVHTGKIIRKLPYFSFVKQMKGVRLFFRFYLTDFLCNKYPVFRNIRIFLIISDLFLNSITIIRSSLWKLFNPYPKSISIVESGQIDKQLEIFIRQKNREELCRRGKKELEWILNNPWVVKKTKANEDLLTRYYFSSVASSFSYIGLKFSKKEELLSFMMLKERDGHYEIPYCYFDEKDKTIVFLTLMHYLIKKDARSFTYFNVKMSDFHRIISSPYVFYKKLYRELMVSKELLPFINEKHEIQDGDGDVAFT